MIDISLDSTGDDILIRDFDLVLIDEVDQIAQNLKIRLRFFLGEWYLDTQAGLPFYSDILVKAPNQYRVESLIKQEIVDTEGVEEITSFTSNYDGANRRFSVQFEATTVSGTAALEIDLL